MPAVARSSNLFCRWLLFFLVNSVSSYSWWPCRLLLIPEELSAPLHQLPCMQQGKAESLLTVISHVTHYSAEFLHSESMFILPWGSQANLLFKIGIYLCLGRLRVSEKYLLQRIQAVSYWQQRVNLASKKKASTIVSNREFGKSQVKGKWKQEKWVTHSIWVGEMCRMYNYWVIYCAPNRLKETYLL